MLKRYAVGGPNSAQLLQAVAREVANLQQLTHPNVIRLEGYFSEKDAMFVQLEYVAGGTLAEWMQARCDFDFDACTHTHTHTVISQSD